MKGLSVQIQFYMYASTTRVLLLFTTWDYLYCRYMRCYYGIRKAPTDLLIQPLSLFFVYERGGHDFLVLILAVLVVANPRNCMELCIYWLVLIQLAEIIQ
jgi:hypothetical protein